MNRRQFLLAAAATAAAPMLTFSSRLFAAPPGVDETVLADAEREEGWILGAGR